MAKAQLYFNPRPQYFINGSAASGAFLFFYEVGTTTKKNTYTDATKNTANPNPVILDSQGRPANSGSPIDIFLDGAYKVVLAPSTDTDPPTNAVWTVSSVTTLGQLETTSAKSTDYTILETDRDKTFLVDASGASRTITLIAAASAGAGFTITVKKTDSSSNSVVLDGNGSETVDGSTTYSLSTQYESVSITCDGSNWHVKYRSTTSASVSTEDSRTNTVVYPLVVTATTSGAPAAGIGTGIKLKAESGDENPSDFGAIEFAATDVTAGTEDTYFSILTRTAGAALTEAYRWLVTGVGKYIFTGAPSASRTITLPDANITIGGALTTTAAVSITGAFSTDAATSFTLGNTAVFDGTLTATRTYTLQDTDMTLGAAAQSDMETATSNTIFVTPGRVIASPYAAKAWLTATYGSPTISESKGVGSLTDTGVGICTINFSVAFSTATYCCIGGCVHSTSADGGGVVGFAVQGASSVQLAQETNGDSSLNNTMADRTPFYAVFFGDQ